MISGVLYALLAGLMWGLIFVGPLIVPEYPAILQSTGRYLALGLIAVPLAWLGRTRLRQLGRQDWLTALALTMMGNLIYYVCLASAIQRTGAPVSTMIIGTLPWSSRFSRTCFTASVTENWRGQKWRRRWSALPWGWCA